MRPRRRAILAGLALTIAVLLVRPGPGSLGAAEPPAAQLEDVRIPLDPLPFDLKGYLRRPGGNGPFPGVVLVPTCDRLVNIGDRDWGAALSSWGYVALTLDVFTAHGLVGRETCLRSASPELADDIYRGVDLLVERKLVDPERIFAIGFGRGGSQVFAAVDRDGVLKRAKHKLRAAVAFYPPCGDIKGVMAVPILVLVGARDEQELDACRKLARGEDDMGISRQPGVGAPIQLIVVPDAYAGFDVPLFQKPFDIRGLHIEYSKAAADKSKEMVRKFLQEH